MDDNELPQGEIAFCFTDIEGSTKRFARLGARFLDLLEEHRRIVRAAVATHGGSEVKTEGDGFFLAFPTATSAVAACVDLQRGMADHAWPTGEAVRVRAGIHAGHATPRDGDYLVFAVHEAARISAAAHGGQIVVSDLLAGVIDGARLPGVTLRDLGEHLLKDLEPMRLHQVCAPGLEEHFPPLRSVDSARGYVPAPSSALVGRDEEVAALQDHLERARLVTISGAGGIGKTRLAVEVGNAALGTKADGVWFVDLAPLADPERIDDVLLEALGIVREGPLAARAQVLGHLAAREVILVLDNCEHLVDPVSALVDDLLRAGPRVVVLATTREPLSVDGEHVWRLRSLDQAAGVELFVARAGLVHSDFAIDDENRADVVRIVEHLDGIPLAIELAAARVRVLTPGQIAERLDDRFQLLTGGRRTALARHRTLEAAVDWSHDLLDEDERSLLRHLSVFVGGFDLEGATTVWGRDPLDSLERLVDKSMVQATLVGDAVRYRLLETIRDYAWRKLAATDEAGSVRDRHLRHAVAVGRTALGLLDEREVAAAAALNADLDNIRAGLEWAFSRDDPRAALDLVAHLWIHWAVTGRSAEGLSALRRALDAVQSVEVDGELLAQAHAGAAHLCMIYQEPHEALGHHASWVVERARQRPPGDPVRWYDAWAMANLVRVSGTIESYDVDAAQEALDWSRAAETPFVTCDALHLRAGALLASRAGADPLADMEEAVAVARQARSTSMVAYSLAELVPYLIDAGRLDDACRAGAEGVEAARRSPNVWFMTFALKSWGQAKAYRDDDDAPQALREAASLAANRGLEYAEASAELELGAFAIQRGDAAEARRAFSASQATLLRVAPHRPQMFLLAAQAGHLLGEAAALDGDLPAARAIYETTLGMALGVGVGWVTGYVRCSLGWLAIAEGDADEAEAQLRLAAEAVGQGGESVARERQITACILRGMAGVALLRGDPVLAARRSGAASQEAEPSLGASRLAWRRHAEVVDRTRAALGEAAFSAAWAEGRAAGMAHGLAG